MLSCESYSEISFKITMTEGADKDSSHIISPCGIISVVGSRKTEDSTDISLNSVPRERSKTPPPVLGKDNVVSAVKLPGNRNPVATVASRGAAPIAEACSADGDSSRRHLKSSSLPHGVKLCPEAEAGKGESLCVDVSSDLQPEEDKWAALEAELRNAQSELKAKDAEVEKLKGIRQQVEGELTDLTAALFEVRNEFLHRPTFSGLL